MINQPFLDSGVYERQFSCLGEYFVRNEFSKYLYIDHETELIQRLLNPKGIFFKKKTKQMELKRMLKIIESNDSSEEDSTQSEEKIEHNETEASSLVKCNDIAVIEPVKLKKNPFLTDCNIKDDYG